MSRNGTSGDAPTGVPGWAWGLCWLMFACTVLNYMDRQAMAVVGPQVKAKYHLDNVGFGWVLAAFQVSYAFFQWPAGSLVDRGDLRRTYAAAVTWWSLAGIATAFAPSLGALLACRALLGMGESFNWPCALRVTGRVLPPADRSLGNGIFNSGAAVGAVLTPLIVVPMAARSGWRTPFLVLGVAGLAWVVAWTVLTWRRTGLEVVEEKSGRGTGLAPPARWALGIVVILAASTVAAGYWLGLSATWMLSAAWMAVAVLMIGPLMVARLMPMAHLRDSAWMSGLAEVARLRRFWIMVAVGCTINVSWHFLVNWMATFFQEGLRLGSLVGGLVIAVPFLAADLGNLVGGVAVRDLVRRGWSPTSARKLVLCGCMILIASAVGVGIVVAAGPKGRASLPLAGPSDPMGVVLKAVLVAIRANGLVIGLLSLAALGTAAFMVNYFAFGQEVAPRHTGLVIGYLGGLGNLFAAGFLPLAGWISQGRWGFAPNFWIVGTLPVVGLVALLVGWDRAGSEGEAI